MGSLLTQPITEKKTDQGEGLGLRYGLSSMQGWRLEMEDAHFVKVGLPYGLDDWSFFAVFDGHAGGCAAKYASSNLLEYILRDREIGFGKEIGPEPLNTEHDTNTTNTNDENNKHTSEDTATTKQQQESEKSNNLSQSPTSNGNDLTVTTATSAPENQMIDNKTSSIVGEDSPENPSQEIKNISLDQLKDSDGKKIINVPISDSYPNIKLLDMTRAIRSGFLQIDQAMRSTDLEMSGCTAVCSLISPTHLFIANCGDSRAVLFDGTSPKFATEDHKPYHPNERKRIIDAGGTATERINGTLAVSRALGDFDFKKDERLGATEQLVSPEPEVTIIERQPSDEFLILACDGIWDVMKNEELCQYVRYLLMIESDLQKICNSVLDVCLRRRSRDNMSIIIVVFESGPKVQEEEVERDKKNDLLLYKLTDWLQENYPHYGPDGTPDFTFDSFMTLFTTEDVHQHIRAPPGVGFEAKYDLIRKRYLKNKNICEEEKNKD